MKKTLLTLAAVGCALPFAAVAGSYSTFRVCEDQHVLRTSDGAEAGHVQYIVVDPEQQRIVSTVITGGAIGEKYVAVPFSAMRFGGNREVTLTEITRERLISAPVIERREFTTTSVIEPTVIQSTFTHFGVDITTGRSESRGETRSQTQTGATIDGRSQTVGGGAANVQGNIRGAGTNADPRSMTPGGAATTTTRENGGRAASGATEAGVANPGAPNAGVNATGNASGNPAATPDPKASPANKKEPATGGATANGKGKKGKASSTPEPKSETTTGKATEKTSPTENAPSAEKGKSLHKSESKDTEGAAGGAKKPRTEDAGKTPGDTSSPKAADKSERNSEKAVKKGSGSGEKKTEGEAKSHAGSSSERPANPGEKPGAQ